MLKRCIIHIGMHKTGSSSIQRSLSKNLKNEEFTYATLRMPNHSVEICSLFQDNPLDYGQNKKRKHTLETMQATNENTMKMLLESINSCKTDNMLISGEGISLHLSEKELIKMKSFFQNYFEKILIVAYIRSPHNYIVSAFQQKVKSRYANLDIKQLYPNYKKRFEKFYNVFGKKNVSLWNFNPKLFVGKDVVMDFCTKLDIEFNQEDTIRVNESLTREAISLLYIYNRYCLKHKIEPKKKRKFIEGLRKLKGTKLNFSLTLTNFIINSNIEDIKWIEEKMGSQFSNSIEVLNSITCEDDLLHSSEELVFKLSELVGSEYSLYSISMDREEVIGKLMHTLYLKSTSLLEK